MPVGKWKHQLHTVGGAWLAIEEIRERIDGMELADEVAKRVKSEIESHRMIGFTLAQKVLAAVIAALTAGDLVLNMIHLWHHG